MIRRLGPDEAGVFRVIRREALITTPEAFASTTAYLDAQTDADLADRLSNIPTFAAFEGDTPVGLMGYLRETGDVMGHRAFLINVYVSPSQRGKGLARGLLTHVLDAAASEGITQMELMVTVQNTAAIAVYERAGFQIVGTIPNGMCHDGQMSDEYIMVKPIAP